MNSNFWSGIGLLILLLLTYEILPLYFIIFQIVIVSVSISLGLMDKSMRKIIEEVKKK